MPKKLTWPKPEREFDLHPYVARLYLFTDRDKYHRARLWMQRKSSDPAATRPTSAGITAWMSNEVTKDQCFLVGVFDESLSTLAHELQHVRMDVAELCGFDPTQANGEPISYLMGFMFANTMNFITPDEVSSPYKYEG